MTRGAELGRGRVHARFHIGVLAVYAGVAAVFLDHGESLTRRIAAPGPDPLIFIWFLKWWPWALLHGKNLFHTDLVWQPVGVATPWVTSIPFLSFLILPVTIWLGPVPAYNFLVIAAPVCSSFAAYVFCLRLAGDWAAAAIGGFLFGFSSYATQLVYATPNLSMTAFVPLLLLAGLLRGHNEMARGRFVALVCVLLVAEFLTSLEVVASLFLFCGLGWCVGYAVMRDWRPVLAGLLMDVGLAGVAAAFVLSPVLAVLCMNRHYLNIPWYWAYQYNADALGLVALAPGGLAAQAMRWLTGLQTATRLPGQASLGILGLLIAVFFALENRRRPAALLLAGLLAVMVLASLGPQLRFGGRLTAVWLPWSLLVHLPLLGAILTSRFALYVSLIAAVMAALWIAGAPAAGRKFRFFAGLLACVLTLPAFKPWAPVPVSAFFAHARAEAVLGPRPRILILPFAINGVSSYWQAENDFGFSQTGGYLGPPPAAFINDPAVVQLFDNAPGASLPADFTRLCEATRTQFVIAGPGTPAALLALLAKLDWRPQKFDDVTVYTVPGQTVAGAGHG